MFKLFCSLQALGGRAKARAVADDEHRRHSVRRPPNRAQCDCADSAKAEIGRLMHSQALRADTKTNQR